MSQQSVPEPSFDTPLSTAAERAASGAADRALEHIYVLLKTLFTVAPIVFGLDKFANVLTQWDGYLAPWINNIVPGTATQAMYAVGVIEIVAGVLVAIRPRIGSLVVAAWLGGIIVNLLTYSGFYDVALRDAGLLVAALCLYVAATAHDAVGGAGRARANARGTR